MPNYYAHFRFGAMVLAALPPTLAASLEGCRAAFDLGCLGPDPLYFYRPSSLKNPIRTEAFRMHHCPGRVPLERLRRAMAQNGDSGRGAAAGFLCHFALDSTCHVYVNRVTTGRGHTALEVGFDRLLMAEDGFSTPRTAGFPPLSHDPSVYRAAAAAYRLASGPALRTGYHGMSVYARGLGRLYGVLGGEQAAVMHRLMDSAAAPTARRLTDYLSGAPLDSWYDRDFYGHRSSCPA